MKHERKEQLEANDLEVFIRVKLPKIWKKHGNTVLMVVILICAAILFMNYRRHQMTRLENLTQNNLAIGWDSLRELQVRFHMLDLSDDATAERMRVTRNTLETFDAVLSTNPKPYSKAWATLGRAEVYWLLANAPQSALTTTQPIMGPATQSTEGYLAMAEDGYKQVITNHADQKKAFITALFGLAAIEENRRALADAATWYDKVIESADADQADKAFARRRKMLLDEYKKPLLIKGITQPSTQPST